MGFVVKAPYTTNCSYIRFVSSFEGVVAACNKACQDLFGSIPYVMVQPKMYNRREHKVICWDGEPHFICSFSNSGSTVSEGGINKSFCGVFPHRELFDFVKHSVQVAKGSCPQLLTDGLFRVDVFQRVDGSFVVNEFESLEANFPCLRGILEFQTFAFMKLYLSRKLIECVKRLEL